MRIVDTTRRETATKETSAHTPTSSMINYVYTCKSMENAIVKVADTPIISTRKNAWTTKTGTVVRETSAESTTELAKQNKTHIMTKMKDYNKDSAALSKM